MDEQPQLRVRRFTLDPIAYRRSRWRWVQLGVPVLCCVIYFAATDFSLLTVGIFVLVFAMWIFTMVVTERNALRTYELLASERVLRRTASGWQAEIVRPEVHRIIETSGGLVLRNQKRGFSVPRWLRDYDELRAHVATWATIESAPGWSVPILVKEGLAQVDSNPDLLEELELVRSASAIPHVTKPVKSLHVGWILLALAGSWIMLLLMIFLIGLFLTPAR